MVNVSKSRKDNAHRSNPFQASRGSDKNLEGLSALEALAMELSSNQTQSSSPAKGKAARGTSGVSDAGGTNGDNAAKVKQAAKAVKNAKDAKAASKAQADTTALNTYLNEGAALAQEDMVEAKAGDAAHTVKAAKADKSSCAHKTTGGFQGGRGRSTKNASDLAGNTQAQVSDGVSSCAANPANTTHSADVAGGAAEVADVAAEVAAEVAETAAGVKAGAGAEEAGSGAGSGYDSGSGLGLGSSAGLGAGAEAGGAGDEALSGVANMDAGIVADESAMLSSDVSSAQHDSNNQLGDQRARLAAESVLRKVDKGHLSASSEDHQLHHISGKTFDLAEIFPDLKLLSKSEQDLVNEDFLSGYEGKLNHLLNYRRLERMGATEFGVISDDGLRDLIAKTYEQTTQAQLDELYKLFTNIPDKNELASKLRVQGEHIFLDELIDLDHPCELLRFTEQELEDMVDDDDNRLIRFRRQVQASFVKHEEKLLKAIIDYRFDPMTQEYQELVFYRYILAWRTGDKADFERYKQLVELQNLYTLFKLLAGSFETKLDFDLVRYRGKGGLEQIKVYTNPHEVKEFSLCHFIYLLEPLKQCLMDDAPLISDWLEALSIINHKETKQRYFSEGLPYDFNFVSPVLTFVIGVVANLMYEDNARCIMDGLKDAERRPFMYYDIFVGNSRAKCEKHADFNAALADVGGSIENALKDNEFTPQMQEWLVYLQQLVGLDSTLNLLEALNFEPFSSGRLWFMNKMTINIYFEMFNYWCRWQSNTERKQKFVTNHINDCMTKFSQGQFAAALSSNFVVEARNFFLKCLSQHAGLLSQVKLNPQASLSERLGLGHNGQAGGFGGRNGKGARNGARNGSRNGQGGVAAKLESLTQELAQTNELLGSSLIAILRGNNGVTGELQPEELIFLKEFKLNPKERSTFKAKVVEGFNQILHMHLDVENHPEVHMNLELAQYIGDTGAIPLIPGISAHTAFLIARAMQNGDFGIRDQHMAQMGFFYADLSGHYLATMYKANLYCPMFDNIPGEAYLGLLLRANFAAHLTAYCDECLYGSKYLGTQIAIEQVNILKNKKSSYESKQGLSVQAYCNSDIGLIDDEYVSWEEGLQSLPGMYVDVDAGSGAETGARGQGKKGGQKGASRANGANGAHGANVTNGTNVAHGANGTNGASGGGTESGAGKAKGAKGGDKAMPAFFDAGPRSQEVLELLKKVPFGLSLNEGLFHNIVTLPNQFSWFIPECNFQAPGGLKKVAQFDKLLSDAGPGEMDRYFMFEAAFNQTTNLNQNADPYSWQTYRVLNLFKNKVRLYDTPEYAETYYNSWALNSEEYARVFKQINPAFTLRKDDEGDVPEADNFFYSLLCNTIVMILDFVETRNSMFEVLQGALYCLMEHLYSIMERVVCHHGCLVMFKFLSSIPFLEFVSTDNRFKWFCARSRISQILYTQINNDSAGYNDYTDLLSNMELSNWDIAGIFLQLGMCSSKLRELGYNLLDRTFDQRVGNFLPATMPYLDELFKTSAALHNGNSLSYLDSINRQNHKIEQADLFALVGKMSESIRTYRDVVRYYTRYDLGEARLELAQHMILLRQPYGYYEMFLCLKDNPERMREAHTYLYYAAKLNVGEAQHALEGLQHAQLFKPLPFLVYFLSLQELSQRDLSALLCLLMLSVDNALVPCNFTDYLKTLELYQSKFSNNQLKQLLFKLGLLDLERSLNLYNYPNLLELFPNPIEGLQTGAEAVNGNFTALHEVLNWQDMFKQSDGLADRLTLEECDARVRVLLNKLYDTLKQGKTSLEGLLLFNWTRSFTFPKCLFDKRQELFEKEFSLENGIQAVQQEKMSAWLSEFLDANFLREDDWSLVLPVENTNLKEAEILSELIWTFDSQPSISRKTMQTGALMALRSRSGRSYAHVFSALVRYLANSGDMGGRHYTLLDFGYMQVVPYGNRFENYVGHQRRELICKIAQQKKGMRVSDLLKQVVEQFDPSEVLLNRYLRDIVSHHQDAGHGFGQGLDANSSSSNSSASSSSASSAASANSGGSGSAGLGNGSTGLGTGSAGLGSGSGAVGSAGLATGSAGQGSSLDSVSAWLGSDLGNVVVETILDDSQPQVSEQANLGQDLRFGLGAPGTNVAPDKCGTNELLNYSYFLMLHSHCGVIPALVCMKNPWLLNRKANGPVRSYSSHLAKALLNNEPGAWHRYLYYVQSHYFKYNLSNENFEGEDSQSAVARKFVNDVLQLNIDSRKFGQFLDGMRKEGVKEFDGLLYANENGYVPGRYRIINHADLTDGTYDVKSGMYSMFYGDESEQALNPSQDDALAARDSLKTLASKIDNLSAQDPQKVAQALVQDPLLAVFLGQDAARLKDGNVSHHWINYTFYPEANAGSLHGLLQMLPYTNSLLEECIRENVGLSLEENSLLSENQELSFLYNPRLVQWHSSKFRIQQEEKFDYLQVEPEQALQRFNHPYDNALYQIDRTRFNILRHAPVQAKSLSATIEAQAAWGAMRNQQLDLQGLNANYSLSESERQAAWQAHVGAAKAKLTPVAAQAKAKALAKVYAAQAQAKAQAALAQAQAKAQAQGQMGADSGLDALSAVTFQEGGQDSVLGAGSAGGIGAAGGLGGDGGAGMATGTVTDDQNQLITEDGYDSLLEQRLLQAIYHHSPMIDEVFYTSAQGYYKELLLKVVQAIERSPDLKRPGGPLSAILENAHVSGQDGGTHAFNTVVSEDDSANAETDGYHVHEDDKVINENRASEANLLKHLQSFLSEKIGDVVPPTGMEGASSKPHNMRDEIDVQNALIMDLLKRAWNFDESQERQFTRPAMFHEDENPLHTVIYLIAFCYQQRFLPQRLKALNASELMNILVHHYGYFYGACDVVDNCFAPMIIESFKRRYYRDAFWHVNVDLCIQNCYDYFTAALRGKPAFAQLPAMWRMNDKVPQACLKEMNISGKVTLNDLYTDVYPTFLYLNVLNDPHTVALSKVTRAQVQEHVEVLMDDSFLSQGMYDFMTDPELVKYSKCVQGNTYASTLRQWHTELCELAQNQESNSKYPPLATLRAESLSDLALWQRESEEAIARLEPQWLTSDPSSFAEYNTEHAEFETLLYKTEVESEFSPGIYNPIIEVFARNRHDNKKLYEVLHMNDLMLERELEEVKRNNPAPGYQIQSRQGGSGCYYIQGNSGNQSQGSGQSKPGKAHGKGKGKGEGNSQAISCVGDDFSPVLDFDMFSTFTDFDHFSIENRYEHPQFAGEEIEIRPNGIAMVNGTNLYEQLTKLFGSDPDLWNEMEEDDDIEFMDDDDFMFMDDDDVEFIDVDDGDIEDVEEAHHNNHKSRKGNKGNKGNKKH